MEWLQITMLLCVVLLQIGIIESILQKLDVTFIKNEKSTTVDQQLQYNIPNRFVKEPNWTRFPNFSKDRNH